MAIRPDARSPSQSDSPLGRLVRERGLEYFALFFVTGEGQYLPNGDEEKSGHVIDAHGRIFSFWTSWDAEHNAPTFSEWEAVDASPSWLRSAEYREARSDVGLDASPYEASLVNGERELSVDQLAAPRHTAGDGETA